MSKKAKPLEQRYLVTEYGYALVPFRARAIAYSQYYKSANENFFFISKNRSFIAYGGYGLFFASKLQVPKQVRIRAEIVSTVEEAKIKHEQMKNYAVEQLEIKKKELQKELDIVEKHIANLNEPELLKDHWRYLHPSGIFY